MLRAPNLVIDFVRLLCFALPFFYNSLMVPE